MNINCSAKFCFDRNSGYILLCHIMRLLIWPTVNINLGQRHTSLLSRRSAVLVSFLQVPGVKLGFVSEKCCEIRCMKNCEVSVRIGNIDGIWKTQKYCFESQGGSWLGTVGLPWRLFLSTGGGDGAFTSETRLCCLLCPCLSIINPGDTDEMGAIAAMEIEEYLLPVVVLSSHQQSRKYYRKLHYPRWSLLLLVLWQNQARHSHFEKEKKKMFLITVQILKQFCLKVFLSYKCKYWCWWESQGWLILTCWSIFLLMVRHKLKL